LYVLDLVKGTTIATLNVPNGNGLSSPAALNSKYGTAADTGVVDRVYAGDLGGNLWVFDLSSTDPAQWKVLANPLFQVHDSLGNAQPITSRPVLTRASQGGYMVIFGTGQLLYGGDETSSATQAMYGVLDTLPANGNGWPLALSSLQKNVIADETSTSVSGVDGAKRSYIARNVTAAATTVSNPSGWYLPLQSPGLSNGGGERMLYDPLLLSGRLYFTTQIPRVNTSNHCLIGGAGWLMALDPLTGQRLARSPFDLDRSGQYNSSADLVTFPSSGTPQVVAGIQIGSGMPSALSFSAGSKKVAMQPYQTRDGQVVNALTPSSSLSNGGVLSYGTSANPPGGAFDPNNGLMPITPDPATARRLSWREIF
jgi:type IV pilus assembly protein PilY1